MTEQEFAVAEAPEDADTGKSSVASRLDINITITYIDGGMSGKRGKGGGMRAVVEFLKGGEDGIGSWLFADTCHFVLADGHLDGVREEMAAEFLSGSHHLVADDGQSAASGLQGSERLGDAVVRPGGIE